MKRKLVSVVCTFVLTVSLVIIAESNASASDGMLIIEDSQLTHDNESTGTAVKRTRGADLQTGYSKIVKLGDGVIYVGGSTIANHTVESIQVTVIVEKAKEDDTEWTYLTHWHKENKNEYVVNANQRLEVEGGWYYRARAIHSAGNDITNSFTNGIFIE